MAEKIVTVCLIIVAVIHLLPLAGLAGGERLQALYGVEIADPNLELLMRHRAVLFGLLGIGLLVGAFIPTWHAAALLAGAISVVSFLGLAASIPTNAEVARVVAADWLALAALLAGAVATAFSRL